MRHILIALNNGTDSLRDNVTSYLVGTDWPYWHWIDDVWIVDPPEGVTTQSIHDDIDELIDKKRVLVFEFKGTIKYWGRNAKEAWKWLAEIGKADR